MEWIVLQSGQYDNAEGELRMVEPKKGQEKRHELFHHMEVEK